MTMNEGWHRGKAIDFGLSVSDSGTEAIAILLRVADGDPSEDGGKIITTYLYCTDAAIDNTVAALRIFGWAGDNLSDFESSEARTVSELLPNDVTFPVNNEEYNGKVNSKVGKICKAGSGKVAIKNRIEGAAAKSFSARFRGACAANPATGAPAKQGTAAKSKPAATAATQQASDVGSDNEFPF